jgi:hypothetical protein
MANNNFSDYNHYTLFYVRPESFSRFISGANLPTLATLNDTHVMVGAAVASDLEHLFARMNLFEEDGLPRIFRRGASHTSMSVGDVARVSVWEGDEIVGYRYWVCAGMGWTELS